MINPSHLLISHRNIDGIKRLALKYNLIAKTILCLALTMLTNVLEDVCDPAMYPKILPEHLGKFDEPRIRFDNDPVRLKL